MQGRHRSLGKEHEDEGTAAMSSNGRLMGRQDGLAVASDDGSHWKVVVTVLAIVVIACALGWKTFQSDPGAWIPLGASGGAVVDQ